MQEINGVQYFVAGRKILNIDKTIVCRILTNLLGFVVDQRRLKSILPFYIKLGDPKAWVNQCLCCRCSNSEFAVDFLNKMEKASDDGLLKILDLDGLLEIICCEDADKRNCLSNLQKEKCFLHGNSKSDDCSG